MFNQFTQNLIDIFSQVKLTSSSPSDDRLDLAGYYEHFWNCKEYSCLKFQENDRLIKDCVCIIERCVSHEMIETKTRKEACVRIRHTSMQNQSTSESEFWRINKTASHLHSMKKEGNSFYPIWPDTVGATPLVDSGWHNLLMWAQKLQSGRLTHFVDQQTCCCVGRIPTYTLLFLQF